MANRKISDLTALTTPATGDLLPIVDISEAAAANKNKKITIGELFASIPLGTAAAPSIAFEGDSNTGIFSPGADQLAISTNGTQRATIDSSGRLLVATATSDGNFNSGVQIAGIGGSNAGSQLISRFSADTTSPSLWFQKSRGASVGTNTIVNNGDDLGLIGFYGANGSTVNEAARITAQVDGTPGASSDMPGRLVFSTTLDGASSPTERMRITNAGLVGLGTSSPAAILHTLVSQAGSTAAEIFRAQATNTTDNVFTRLDVAAEPALGTASIVRLSAITGNAANSANMAFNVRNAGVSTEVLRLSSTGRVGIGSTSPSSKLVVEDSSALKIAVLRTGTAVVGMGVESGPYVYSDGALQFRVGATAGGSADERARIDSSGRLLVGTSASTHQNAPVQIVAATTSLEHLAGSNSAGDGAYIFVSRSRGTAASRTGVQNNDNIAKYAFYGYSGAASAFSAAAEISVWVDGEPDTAGDTTDMPGRLVFSTTADGAASLTEALRITNDRVIAYNQPTPTSKSAAATLTITELKTRIIEYTGAVATLTLPTGTLMEGGFSGIYTNMAFEWSVINTGSGICTIGAGTAHTIVGSATVAIGASARFVSRRTAANTFVSYRLS